MTSIGSNLEISLDALRANKFRSTLTMLGIIIGVGAVIATVAVGSGATQRIEQEIASMGSNLIVVLSGSVTSSGIRLGSGNAVTLTADDAQAIATECPAVARVAPTSRGGAQVVAGNNNWATSVQGTTPEYLEIRELRTEEGRVFTQQEVDSSAKVALLGKTVADNLFAGAGAVGQVIRIKKVPFTVIGVLGSKGQSPSGQDQDDVIIAPLTTVKKKLLGTNQASAGSVGAIMVQAAGAGQMADAETQIRDLLRQRHHLQQGQEDDFSVRNLEEVFSAQENSANVMSVLLAAIASVSLLVGGIGIMNIMMVSVTERTREIGIRKAIGARMTDILTQFLFEAVTLSLVGGIIGIVAGTLGSMLISYIAGWSTVISSGTILMAFLFSSFVGVFFGYYPALRAARMDPIQALRYE
jgi:putative ABC transport system permease protein